MLDNICSGAAGATQSVILHGCIALLSQAEVLVFKRENKGMEGRSRNPAPAQSSSTKVEIYKTEQCERIVLYM